MNELNGGRVICSLCVGLYLLLIFYYRDLARVGFYLLAVLGLCTAYREMIYFHRHKILKYLILFLCVTFIIFLLAFFQGNLESIREKLLIHLFILFLFVLLNCVFEKWTRILLNLSILIVLSAILSYVFSDYPIKSVKYFEDHYDIFLLLAPIIYAIYKYGVSSNVLYILLIFSCTFSGFSIVLDYIGIVDSELWILDIYKFDYPRFGANIHPIQFATLVACMASVTAAVLVLGANKLRIDILCMGVAGILFAMVALFASGTRGVWISIPFIAMTLVLISLKTIKNKVLSILGGLVIVLILIQVPGVNDRLSLAVSELDKYMSSNDLSDPIRRSSVGVRLEMWKVSWDVFQDNPVFGVGPGVLSNYMQAQGYAKSGKYNSDVVSHRNPHNMYIKALTDRGLIGLVLFILILLVPFLIFRTIIVKCESKELRGYALSGIFVVIIYSISGITIGALDNRQTSMCYIFFISILSGMVLRLYERKEVFA